MAGKTTQLHTKFEPRLQKQLLLNLHAKLQFAADESKLGMCVFSAKFQLTFCPTHTHTHFRFLLQFARVTQRAVKHPFARERPGNIIDACISFSYGQDVATRQAISCRHTVQTNIVPNLFKVNSICAHCCRRCRLMRANTVAVE